MDFSLREHTERSKAVWSTASFQLKLVGIHHHEDEDVDHDDDGDEDDDPGDDDDDALDEALPHVNQTTITIGNTEYLGRWF